jgi:long-chain acyl-CoA synthetase
LNFVATIFSELSRARAYDPVIEVHGRELVATRNVTLLEWVDRARAFLNRAGVSPGDRVVILAPNSTRWVACDLAILASGAVSVPLYSRQDAKELAFMAADCRPSLVITSDDVLAAQLKRAWPRPCRIVTFDELFATLPATSPVHAIGPGDPVTIVYTSGTSGDPKGAVITRGNVDYMLERTISRLRAATGSDRNDDRVFHYLPVCFMGSRILLWTQLYRGNPLMLSTDLTNLKEELAAARSEYFLNVPALLERIRAGVTEQMRAKNVLVRWLYRRGYLNGAIRKNIGKNLKFLICGSAALSEETQRWFEGLGIPVLQVYGLTETTAIVTMDRPGQVKAGWTGYPVEGCDVRLSAEGELLCRGPNVFAGYWDRPDATAEAIREGWLHTGDQAEIDASGNLRIIGRMKNVLVPASGHNVAPEPIEQKIVESCPGAEHAVLIGHGRPFLAAIVTGNVSDAAIEAALKHLNDTLPHYRKVRTYYRALDKLTTESGLLTANQKLRRKAIEEHFREPIERIYQSEAAV